MREMKKTKSVVRRLNRLDSVDKIKEKENLAMHQHILNHLIDFLNKKKRIKATKKIHGSCFIQYQMTSIQYKLYTKFSNEFVTPRIW